MYDERQRSYGNRQSGSNRSNSGDYSDKASPQSIVAEPLPEDYVKTAEEAIVELRRMEQQEKKYVITTSKLRSLFSLFTETYNAVSRGDQDKLSREQVSDLSAARVRIYYEIGREDHYNGFMSSASVGRFAQQTKLLAYLGDIGDSCDKLLRFYRYMEALVAFHRFYFGEKKDRN